MSKKASVIRALIAAIAPALNALVFYVLYSQILRTEPSRTVALLMLVVLVAGGYCGLVALRSKDASLAVRIVGLTGAVVCIIWAVPLLIFVVLEAL